MDRWQYIAVLCACVAVTLPLEGFLGARVYRRPRRLVATLVPVVVGFGLWDMLASSRGHWWWTPELVTGVRLLRLPLEEWLFFVVVPLCVVLTYEVLGGRSGPGAARAKGAGGSRSGGRAP